MFAGVPRIGVGACGARDVPKRAKEVLKPAAHSD